MMAKAMEFIDIYEEGTRKMIKSSKEDFILLPQFSMDISHDTGNNNNQNNDMHYKWCKTKT